MNGQPRIRFHPIVTPAHDTADQFAKNDGTTVDNMTKHPNSPHTQRRRTTWRAISSRCVLAFINNSFPEGLRSEISETLSTFRLTDGA